MSFQLNILLALIILMQGCSSTKSIKDVDNNKIISVTIYYNSLRKGDAVTLQSALIKKGYLVSVRKNKPLSKKYSSYMYVAKQDHKSAVALNGIVQNILKHNLNTNFFEEKENLGIAKVILTNAESNITPAENPETSYTPQLWSHHQQLNISPELCAVKGENILNSLGFSSVVKNGNYVYGNFKQNRATIKCIEFDANAFVYTAVAGKSVKQVERLRNKIASKL